jgi:hypothetical protein
MSGKLDLVVAKTCVVQFSHGLLCLIAVLENTDDC